MVNAEGSKLVAGIEGPPHASEKCCAETQTKGEVRRPAGKRYPSPAAEVHYTSGCSRRACAAPRRSMVHFQVSSRRESPLRTIRVNS
jgi:hypothetical protein